MNMSREKKTCPCKRLPMCLSSFTAAEYGDLHSLQRSMTVNSRISVVDRVDSGGYTPLHLAAQNGHVAATALLLQLGAKVDSNKAGATPLHRASYSGAISTIRLLLEEKWHCDLLAKDTSFNDGMTPLHKAAAGGRYLAVKLLLDAMQQRNDAGGSMLQQGLEALDSLQRTPLDVAEEFSKNQKEEQQNVRRWDVVAGGVADWNKCVQILKSAEWKVRQGVTNDKQRHALPALPKHLSDRSSCLDCDASGDGSCLTASWEAAFRSALSSSISDAGLATVPAEPVSEVSPDKCAVESTKDQRTDTTTVDGMDCLAEVGQTCVSCGAQSFALYPSKNGELLCRTCSKPRKRLHR